MRRVSRRLRTLPKKPASRWTNHLHDVESMLHQVRVKIVDGLLSIEELEDEAIERLDPLLAESRRDGDRGLRPRASPSEFAARLVSRPDV